jgi:hypothetical protein
MQCQECKGWKFITCVIPPKAVTCQICAGTGNLPDDITYDPDRGHKMYYERLNRCVTLRDEAKRLGIDAGDLARMERGFFKGGD